MTHPKQYDEIEELLLQRRLIGEGDLLPDVVSRLKQRFPELAGEMYLFEHVPDQGEDFYTFIAGNGMVYRVEVSKLAGIEDVVALTPFAEFRKGGWSKMSNRRLDAIDGLLKSSKS